MFQERSHRHYGSMITSSPIHPRGRVCTCLCGQRISSIPLQINQPVKAKRIGGRFHHPVNVNLMWRPLLWQVVFAGGPLMEMNQIKLIDGLVEVAPVVCHVAVLVFTNFKRLTAAANPVILITVSLIPKQNVLCFPLILGRRFCSSLG